MSLCLKRTHRLARYEEELIALYESGRPLEQLAERYRVRVSSVRRFLKTRGFKFSKRKYALNEHYFDKIDTQEKAYFFGLLLADSNHTRNPRGKYTIRLSLKIDDIDMLKSLNNALGHAKPIYITTKVAGFGNKYTSGEVEIVGKHISDRILELGLTPCKSLTKVFPEWIREPNPLCRHFLRGYSDGNGSILVNGPYGRAKTPAIGYYVNSTEAFCLVVKSMFSELLGVNSYISERWLERKTTARQLRVGGALQVRRVLDYLYEGASVYLQRKYDIYKDYFDLYDISRQ